MADTFWTNPQIKLSLTKKDEGQEVCTFLVTVMQKNLGNSRGLVPTC